MEQAFATGSVAHTLWRMSGIWHEQIEVFEPSGRPLADDARSGSPGPAPYERLVYIDFDGERYRQTNVMLRGRPAAAHAFSGVLRDGVLVFDRLGPDAPEHVGVSGGEGVLIYCARRVDEAWQRYSEPDFIRMHGGGRRTRTTVLYRDGEIVRTLAAEGTRLAPMCDRRVPYDPRGEAGAVHEPPRSTQVFER